MVEEKLIESYIQHKELNMQKVVNDYYNYIRCIIKNSSNVTEEDAEEIISDVFFILWKNTKKLDKKAKFSSYIAGVTKNVIFRKCSKIAKETQNYQIEEIKDFDIDSGIQNSEMNEYIIKNLQEKECKIFEMFYYDGLKTKEIAKELNIKLSNVKTTLHRTRKKVRKILREGGFYK